MAAKAPATRIQNYGKGHGYFLDGQKVPGVTTVLSSGIPKPALLDWSAKEVARFVINRIKVARRQNGTEAYIADDIIADLLTWNATRTRPERVGNQGLDRVALLNILKDVRYADLDEASGKGTQVHGLAERLAKGEEIEVPDLLKGHVESYLKFLDEWDPQQALLEAVVINRRHRYMGKLDMIAYFEQLPEWIADMIGKNSGWGLLDIKTSRSGIFAETALQTAGYRRAETMIVGNDGGQAIEAPMPEVDFTGAIWVRADGYSVYAFQNLLDAKGNDLTFRTFLYAQQVGTFMDWKEGAAASIKSEELIMPSRQASL